MACSRPPRDRGAEPQLRLVLPSLTGALAETSACLTTASNPRPPPSLEDLPPRPPGRSSLGFLLLPGLFTVPSTWNPWLLPDSLALSTSTPQSSQPVPWLSEPTANLLTPRAAPNIFSWVSSSPGKFNTSRMGPSKGRLPNPPLPPPALPITGNSTPALSSHRTQAEEAPCSPLSHPHTQTSTQSSLSASTKHPESECSPTACAFHKTGVGKRWPMGHTKPTASCYKALSEHGHAHLCRYCLWGFVP